MNNENKPPLLIVSKGESLADALSGLGLTPQVDQVEEAMEILEQRELAVLLVDMNVAGDPAQLLKKALEADRDMQVLLFASDKESGAALKALDAGAAEVLPRPCEPGRVAAAVRRAGLLWKVQRDLRHWRATLDSAKSSALLGGSSVMQALRERVAKLAAHDASVLLSGEAGTGKARTACHIHASSPRSGERFAHVDCAEFSVEAQEEALFGLEAAGTLGALGAAAGGTLYLHDVDRLSMGAQERLLTAIKTHEYTRVGGGRLHRADLRVISSTREDLRTAVSQGRFLEDLYWALCGVALEMPPLRDHAADIDELLLLFLAEASHRLGRQAPQVPAPIMERIRAHHFPGNVAELKDLAGVIASLSDGGEVGIAALPSQMLAPIRMEGKPAAGSLTLKPAVREFERQYLLRVLKMVGGNQSKAARALDIHRNTLILKMQELGIPNKKGRSKK